MKKIIILFFFLFFISSCDEEVKKDTIRIVGDEIVEEVSYYECYGCDNELKNVYWSVNNSDICEITEDGILIKKTYGEVVITATLQDDLNTKTCLAVYVMPSEYEKTTIFKEAERYIRDNTVNETSNDIEFIKKVPFLEAEIKYEPYNDEFIDKNGKVFINNLDNITPIKVTIFAFNTSYEFNIKIKTLRIPVEEQYQKVKKWLDDKVLPIIENEEGVLPFEEEIYGSKIIWESTELMSVGFCNDFLQSQKEGENQLIARLLIGGEERLITYVYNSKGIKEEDKAKYIEKVLSTMLPKEAKGILSLVYTGNIDIITDLIYPDEANKIRPSSPNDPHQGLKMTSVEYVVIHDTGMTHPNDDARRLNEYIHAQASNDYSKLYSDEQMRVASWHFSIDDKEIYQHVPTDEVAWHAGDGSTKFPNTWINDRGEECLGGGNRNGIGIETCINPENDYILTIKRTAKLTAYLLNKYNLGLDRVKQHYDFSGKNCPNVIRSNGYWDEFMKEVEFQLWLLKMNLDLNITWVIDNENIIEKNGRIKTLDKDEVVNVKMIASYLGSTKTFDFDILCKK